MKKPFLVAVSVYFLILFIIPIWMYAACDSTWTQNASGDWTDTSNWTPNCYPGSAGPTDIATFGSSPTNPLTVTVDTNISLQQFIFDKSYYASPFYTISPDTTEVFTLNDPSPLFSVLHGVHQFNTGCAVTATNPLHISVSDPLGNLIFTAPLLALDSAFFSGPGTMTNHSISNSNPLLFGGDFTIESGIVHNINDITNFNTSIVSDNIFIQNGAIANFENTADNGSATLSVNNDIVINGGILTASNNGNMTTLVGTILTTNNGNTVINDGGILTATNTGHITNAFGVELGLRAVNIDNSSLQILNGGVIDGTDSVGIFFFDEGISINNGNFDISNNGQITGNTNFGIVTFAGELDFIDSACHFVNEGAVDGTESRGVNIIGVNIITNGGSLVASNNGHITGNNNDGVHIESGAFFSGGLIDINNSSLQILNGGVVDGIGCIGVNVISLLNRIELREDGVITMQNTNTVSGASNIGCSLNAFLGLLNIENGTITSENSGNVNAGVGSLITNNSCIMTGGSVTLTNSGSISNGGRGSVIEVIDGGLFQMTGGQITLNDFGTVAPDGSVGAGIISATINQTGGTITNNATILSDIYTIGSGGLLQGIGVINDINQLNAANVFNGGTLHPGIPLGTMTIFGNYTQTNGGTLGIDITPTGASSLLAVSGNVTISTDTTVFVTPEFGTYQSGTTYTIVTNGGAQAGRFSHLTFAYPTFSGHLVYNPHDILLVLDLIPFADFLTGNAKNVAECFQTLTSPDALAISTALTFSSVATIQAAFNAMDPAQFTTLSVAQENANIRVLHGIAFHAGCRSLWIDAFGDLAKQKGKATLPGYKERMGGVILGYDFWRSGRLSLGTALAYTRDHLKWSNARGHASMQTAYFALYGDIHCDHFSSHFALSEGWNAYQETRNIRFPGVNRTAKSHHTGNETAIQASLEHPIKRDCFSFIPHTDLYYIFLHEKGYSEKGANSLDYTYRPKNSDLFRTTIGASIQHTFCRITHEFTLNWIYQTNFRGNELRASFTENPNCVFEVTGLQPSHNLISPAFSLRFCPTSCLTFGLLYVGEFGKNYRNQEVHLSFACNF